MVISKHLHRLDQYENKVDQNEEKKKFAVNLVKNRKGEKEWNYTENYMTSEMPRIVYVSVSQPVCRAMHKVFKYTKKYVKHDNIFIILVYFYG